MDSKRTARPVPLDTSVLKVSPVRGGVFRLLILLAVVALPLAGQVRRDGDVDWNRYYSSLESRAIMAAWCRKKPDLARLMSIGKSYLGNDLWVIEITDRRTGRPEEKPALYVDGNIHSGELTSGALALYFAGYLIRSAGRDPRVTKLLRTHTFYVRPKFNPDGADATLLRDISLRSSVRPVDDDGDGVADEDPAEDIDGDGFVSLMRIEDPDGDRKPSSEDPRLLVRRRKGDKKGPFYRVFREGIDNDGDGQLNEDGLGGLDLNRNFPRNWALPFRQHGAGPFPLSEPETYATVRFIVDHPNITGIVHNHTSGGFVYRLPSASDPGAFDKEDLGTIATFAERFTELTGRPVRPSSTHPTRHRYGTLISWAYWDRGIIGWVPELWPGIGKSRLDALRYQDENLAGRDFIPWKPFDHPTLGRVEIGGLRTRFLSQNPPPELLEKECAVHVPWLLYLAEQSPKLELVGVRSERRADGAIIVVATVRNSGFLPTHLTRRGYLSKVQRPVAAEIEVEGAELLEGSRRMDLGHLAGRRRLDGMPNERTKTFRWIVRPGVKGGRATVIVSSDTGGTVRSKPLQWPRDD